MSDLSLRRAKKKGNARFYKGRYYIAFYKEEPNGDESFYKGFDNVADICKYLGWGTDPKAVRSMYITLYNCLVTGLNQFTTRIDGIRLKPYLIDMEKEIEEDERRIEEMKKYVKITSTINIEVYPDLAAIDATNPNAPMADRLNVKPDWVHPVLILKGVHYYPSAVKDWHALKALEAKSLLSVSESFDEVPEEEAEAVKKMERSVQPAAQKAARKAKRDSAAESQPEGEAA